MAFLNAMKQAEVMEADGKLYGKDGPVSGAVPVSKGEPGALTAGNTRSFQSEMNQFSNLMDEIRAQAGGAAALSVWQYELTVEVKGSIEGHNTNDVILHDSAGGVYKTIRNVSNIGDVDFAASSVFGAYIYRPGKTK
jgi:hypothetical protein